jgi:hypothetical protein
MNFDLSSYHGVAVNAIQHANALSANARRMGIAAASGGTAFGLDLGGLSDLAASVASAAPSVSDAISQTPGLAGALASPDPIGDVLTSPVVGAITSALSPVVNAAMPGAAGATAAATATPTPAVQQGIDAAKAALSGPQLTQARAAITPAALPAFDAGVALAAGAAKFGKNMPAGFTPAQQSGWLIAHGINGAPADVKTAVIAAIAKIPDLRKGALVAIEGIKKGIHPSHLMGDELLKSKLEFGGLGLAVGAAVGAGIGTLAAVPLLVPAIAAALGGAAIGWWRADVDAKKPGNAGAPSIATYLSVKSREQAKKKAA